MITVVVSKDLWFVDNNGSFEDAIDSTRVDDRLLLIGTIFWIYENSFTTVVLPRSVSRAWQGLASLCVFIRWVQYRGAHLFERGFKKCPSTHE
eukprot:scaffold21455_cov116-Cylindrotheca_fusiformis.AAC.9